MVWRDGGILLIAGSGDSERGIAIAFSAGITEVGSGITSVAAASTDRG